MSPRLGEFWTEFCQGEDRVGFVSGRSLPVKTSGCAVEGTEEEMAKRSVWNLCHLLFLVPKLTLGAAGFYFFRSGVKTKAIVSLFFPEMVTPCREQRAEHRSVLDRS